MALQKCKITKYTYGKPFFTDAVTEKIAQGEGAPAYVTEIENGFTYQMGDSDVVYGLGENVRGINKRGWHYISNNTDDPNHREDKVSLYGTHNFIIVDGKERFGLFIDYPGKLSFDIGYTERNTLTITAEEMDLDLYILEGESLNDIVKGLRQMIGRSYIAPKWAFGYGQSRWSYMTADEVREVVKKHRENHIPLDSVYLDIDYMERYKDFTINKETFPDFADFVQEMKEENIHLVPIIDAGVKIEEGYDVYEEGVEKGYFCKEADGSYFTGAVWPGLVHFPDMLNPDARKWFGHKYKILMDQGIDGFWNDMNEPAIFYSAKRIKKAMETAKAVDSDNMDMVHFDEFREIVSTLSNNPEDYKSFYHNVDGKGTMVCHDKVHNLFGYNMTRAAGETFEELEPEKRVLMYSRSSYPGMHRYGGIWQGDNLSWWSHLKLNMSMMPSLNMIGFLYTGADLGGFGADTTEDLMLRWLEFGIFTPLMRNHSALGTRRQEAYQFGAMEAMKKIIGLRYGLLPYIYSEYMKSALRGEMYMKPLGFDYENDAFAAKVEDQLLLGDSIMVAPVYEQNAEGRYVYLPETMKMVKFRSLTERTEEILPAGHHYVPIALDEVVIFIRPNHILPLSKGGENVADTDFTDLELLGYVTEEASYEWYDDDGYGRDYENPANYTTFTVKADKTVEVKGQKKLKVQVNL
ncbi:MAG: glycoside hydrolase family 31 protein [Lachnospiraceae bacterium]|nr:glycoside hydrolase family 31 protein [Lachnospiraceae bacterium]